MGGEHRGRPRISVKCEGCGRRSDRAKQDDGRYGTCACGGQFRHMAPYGATRRAKAQADLARMGR
jgi:hypothetical protein